LGARSTGLRAGPAPGAVPGGVGLQLSRIEQLLTGKDARIRGSVSQVQERVWCLYRIAILAWGNGCMKYAKSYRCTVASLLLLGVTGCGLIKKPISKSHTSSKFSIQVVVSENANQNSPLPMDFVTVADKKLMGEVSKLSAKDWFERRVQVQRDFHSKVQVTSWEWVPGQHAGPISVELPKKTLAGFVFVNYANAGEHRAGVNTKLPVVVTLGQEEFSVQQLK